jgi:hypothetical protein
MKPGPEDPGNRLIEIQVWLAPKLDPNAAKEKCMITDTKTPQEYRAWVLQDQQHHLRTATIKIKHKFIHLLRPSCTHLGNYETTTGCPGPCYMVTHTLNSGLHAEVEAFESMTAVPHTWVWRQSFSLDLKRTVRDLGAEDVGDKLKGIRDMYKLE